MNRLVVNPNRPDSWEIQLKDGVNYLGRGEGADFKITDPSVSSSHCQILVGNGEASIQDLGSTNGTFINGASTQTARLQDGQTIRLGGVEMIFHADEPAPAAATAGARLRVSGIAHVAEAPPPIGSAPPPLLPQFDLSAAAKVCKFHPRNAARWFCGKCKRSFCDLCVNPHGNTKTCRTCAVECAPLEVEITAPVEKGFITSLPGAFIYPFRGTGVLVLIVASLVFAGMGLVPWYLNIPMRIVFLGYLFSYMQNIIHATAAEESQMPELPGMDDVFGGFLRFAGTVVMSFGLTLGLLIARLSGVDLPVSAILISMLLGCLYFPMAFLVVAMKDNVLACNPLVVVPSILRVPLQYIVTVVLFATIFGVQQIGNMIASAAGASALTTTSMSTMFAGFGFKLIWSLLSVYLLTVNMRIMGLLYLTQKEKLGWY